MVDKISFFNNLEYGWKCFYISNCLSRYKDSGWVYTITIVFPLTSSFRCTIDSDVAPRWRTFPCLQMKNISKLFKSSIFNLSNIKQKSCVRKRSSWPDVLYLMHSNAKSPFVMMYNKLWISPRHNLFFHVKSASQMFAQISFREGFVFMDTWVLAQNYHW